MTQLSKWKNGHYKKELINLQKIIDHFGLKTYLADDVIPVKESKLSNG
jgi:hypothetical protein